MQGRLFSYTDTQLSRLGGPNFHEIPINRPIVPVHNNQRDGLMRQTIDKGKSSYNPNTTGGGCPFQAGKMDAGFTSHAERIDAHKIRARSRSFFDHFSQAKLFYNSQSEPEKSHIANALSFELGKVQTLAIRERMLYILSQIDKGLATQVAFALGMSIPKKLAEPLNQSIPADGNPADFQPEVKEPSIAESAALSMTNTIKDTIKTRQIAILAADGVNEQSLNTIKDMLVAAGAAVEVIAPRQGYLTSEGDEQIFIDKSFLTTSSVFYDAVYVPGGTNSVAELEGEPDAIHFLNEAFKHCKAIAADAQAIQLLQSTYFGKKLPDELDKDTTLEEGIVITDNPKVLGQQFIKAIAQHRFWEREKSRKVPA
jgi:catalase